MRTYKREEYRGMRPTRAASWWCDITALLWPDQDVIDGIIKRADEMEAAEIELCINFGFHMRFDYSDYFGALHGYLNNVAQELHKRGIKFADHYTCNLIERPRNKDELFKLHQRHRHHILLHPDEIAAEKASYLGIRYRDICEKSVIDGSRGFSEEYCTDLFCHNNPDFLKMHSEYLKRLVSEVDMDAIMVDDMCMYAGLVTCVCDHCRNKFRERYGHEIPPLSDSGFWGDTSLHPYKWGNYENPVFRDYIKFRNESVAEHVALVKESVGDIPLMTCCSSNGPLYLNAIALNEERMAPNLDIPLLENCGITIYSPDWIGKDPEAAMQLDLAKNMGNAPAVALSYSIYEPGAYLAWALGRVWGVCNWMSTLHGRLERDPIEKKDVPALVGKYNRWGTKYSSYDIYKAKAIPELRIFNNLYNRENGARAASGSEIWDINKAWAMAAVKRNIDYAFVRYEEICDADELILSDAPIVMDSCACLSDAQFKGIRSYLMYGGTVFMRAPFGTKDEKGFERAQAPDLMSALLARFPEQVILITEAPEKALDTLISSGMLKPRIKIISGDRRIHLRWKTQDGIPVIQLLNGACKGIADQNDTLFGNKNVLREIVSPLKDEELSFLIEFDASGLGLDYEKMNALKLKSPELYSEMREVKVERVGGSDTYRIGFDMSGVKIYGIIE